MVCFPGCHGGEGGEEEKEEACGEGLGRKREGMFVGESTKSPVHVEFLLMSCYRACVGACICTYNIERVSHLCTYGCVCSAVTWLIFN